MKKLILSVLALASFALHASELTNFTDVATAVNQGKKLTFVTNLSSCTSDAPLPAIIASYSPSAAMVIDNSRLTASHRHFTISSVSGRDIPLMEFVKYSLDNQGHAQIKVTKMRHRGRQRAPMPSLLINCELGNGFKVFSN